MEAAPPPQIEVTRVSMVAPTPPPPIQRMYLSDLDLLWFCFSNIQSVIFYNISEENSYPSTVERLKKSLSSVLVQFYPLAGRLMEGESGRPEVDCNSEGVKFIEATANIPFEDLEKEGFEYKPYFSNLAPTNEPLEYGNYSSTPLLSIQVTFFIGGSGICIGTSVHHVIADGTSFWHFMKSWGECCRGLPVSNPPLHNRMLLKRECNNLLPLSFKPHEISNDRITGAQIVKPVPDPSRQNKTVKSFEEGDKRKEAIEKWQNQHQPLEFSTFHFGEDMIRQLKQRTGASSSFIALAAHFWRSMVKARKIPGHDFVYFSLSVDCRARVHPPLPPTYFGNFLSVCMVRTTARKLLTEDVSFAARLIKEGITSCTEEEQIDTFMQLLLESTGDKFSTINEEIAPGYFTNVVGAMRMPVYETDYGWGKPLNVQMAKLPEIGGMILLGTREVFNVQVSTFLPRNTMQKFRQIIFDRRFTRPSL